MDDEMKSNKFKPFFCLVFILVSHNCFWSETVSFASCNTGVGDFDVISPALPVGIVTAGTYSDTLTMVVSIQ